MNPSTNPSTTVGAPNAFEPEHRTTSLNLSASEASRCLRLGAARGESRAAFVRSHRAPMERALSRRIVHLQSGRATIHADPRAFVARLDSDFWSVPPVRRRVPGGFQRRRRRVPRARASSSTPVARSSPGTSPSQSWRWTPPRQQRQQKRHAVTRRRLVQTRLVPAKGLMAALATMAADLSSARLVPRLGLGDRAAEVVERAVRGRVRAAFHALETSSFARWTSSRRSASLASESRLGIPAVGAA